MSFFLFDAQTQTFNITRHGVNMAEGTKAPAAAWRFSHNQSGEFTSKKTDIGHLHCLIVDLDAIIQGWDLLFQYRKY